MICAVKPNDINLRRKYTTNAGPFLTIASIFSSYIRLLEIVEMKPEISTVLPRIKSGERREGVFLLKYVIISFVLLTLGFRLFSLHQLLDLFF